MVNEDVDLEAEKVHVMLIRLLINDVESEGDNSMNTATESLEQ